jgi:undecaprenyl-diphosphatase
MLNRLTRSLHPRKVASFVVTEAPLLMVMALVSGLILAFLQIADEMVEGEMEAFDRSILLMFRDPANPDLVIGPPWMHEMVRDITALGSFSLLGLIVLGVCAYLYLARMRSAALFVLVSVLGGTLLSTVLKMGYNRPRPDLTTMSEQFTASFPSGHAMLSAVTFLTLGALLARFAPTRRLQVLSLGGALLLTLLVGLSRLYMGVHYPSDILAGWCLGSAWALLCSSVAIVLQRRGSVDRPAGQDSAGTSPAN